MFSSSVAYKIADTRANDTNFMAYHFLDVDVLLIRQLSRSVSVRDRGCQPV